MKRKTNKEAKNFLYDSTCYHEVYLCNGNRSAYNKQKIVSF